MDAYIYSVDYFVRKRSQGGAFISDIGCEQDSNWDQFIGTKDCGATVAAAFFSDSMWRCVSISSRVGTGIAFACPWV